MPATTLSTYLRQRPADTLGAIGLISGILSAIWGQTYELKPLQPVAMLFFLDSGALLIGLFYGVAMGIGMAAWARKLWAAPVVLVTTMYAWSAAIHTAIRLQSTRGRRSAPGGRQRARRRRWGRLDALGVLAVRARPSPTAVAHCPHLRGRSAGRNSVLLGPSQICRRAGAVLRVATGRGVLHRSRAAAPKPEHLIHLLPLLPLDIDRDGVARSGTHHERVAVARLMRPRCWSGFLERELAGVAKGVGGGGPRRQ